MTNNERAGHFWYVHLMGGLRVDRGEVQITRFQSRQTASLLGMLAHHLGRSYGRDELVEHFWPNADVLRGRHSLCQAISWLRKHLEPPTLERGSVIVATHSHVALNPQGVRTDVQDFVTAANTALHLDASQDRRVDQLVSAMDLYGGDLLPGLYDDWIPPERDRLASLAARVLHEAVEGLRHRGQREAALEVALRGLNLLPLHESVHRDVITLHLELGQRARAITALTNLEHMLQDELGVPPSAETQRLAAMVRQLDASGKAPRAPAPGAASAATPSHAPHGSSDRV
ncbi:MAG: AfsR/SARP family transcriptional regulator [Chthonomonadales bacterium]